MNKKILVIRFSSLGDVVLTTALFPNLKAAWPGCEITVLTKKIYAPLFEGNRSIDHIVGFDPKVDSFSQLTKDVRRSGYDVVIDLHANLRSWFIRMVAGPPMAIAVEKLSWERWKLVLLKKKSKKLDETVRDRILNCLKILEIPVVSQETQLDASGADETLKKFSLEPGSRLIGIAPGSKHNTKRWPADRFAEAANRLGAMPGSVIVVLGDENDRDVAQIVCSQIKVPHQNLVGRTNLRDLTRVVSKLSFLITNDSALLHLAEAFRVPLVAIFGPTVRAFGFAPYRKTSRVVEMANLGCRPCTLHGGTACPLKYHNCMNDLDVSAVMFAASDALGTPPETDDPFPLPAAMMRTSREGCG